MILSTHSMEEAEILCDTVAWLRAGQLVCCGNPEQLKLEHSMGYILHIKFAESNENNNAVEADDDIMKQFSSVFNTPYDTCLKYVMNYPKLVAHLRKMLLFHGHIADKVTKCMLIEIRRDFSFEIVLSVIESVQNELFVQVLTMKENSEDIVELTISMVHLENIFTKMKLQ